MRKNTKKSSKTANLSAIDGLIDLLVPMAPPPTEKAELMPTKLKAVKVTIDATLRGRHETEKPLFVEKTVIIPSFREPQFAFNAVLNDLREKYRGTFVDIHGVTLKSRVADEVDGLAA